MTPVNPLDQLGIRRALVASEVVLAASVLYLAVKFGKGWSWGLFLWGAAFGPFAVLWARWSALVGAGRIVAASRTGREIYERRKAEMWQRYRLTYIGIVLFGLEAGVLSAALEHPGPDIALTVIWLLAGVVPPLVAYPVLRRKALRDAAAQPKDETEPPVQGGHSNSASTT
jgi:hypothetical protein